MRWLSLLLCLIVGDWSSSVFGQDRKRSFDANDFGKTALWVAEAAQGVLGGKGGNDFARAEAEREFLATINKAKGEKVTWGLLVDKVERGVGGRRPQIYVQPVVPMGRAEWHRVVVVPTPLVRGGKMARFVEAEPEAWVGALRRGSIVTVEAEIAGVEIVGRRGGLTVNLRLGSIEVVPPK